MSPHQQKERHQKQHHLNKTALNTLVSAEELYLWRQQAIASAIANEIPITEVDWLLQEVSELDKLSLRLASYRSQKQISLSKSLSQLRELWSQRLQQRLPVQYLVETVFWRHFKLQVTPAVLIPRPETELIIDVATQARQELSATMESEHWVDLGTGSGAIALGLASSLTSATIHGVDSSEAALAIARANAQKYELAEKINFYQGNWWSPLEFLLGKVTGMVSNPPYIPTSEIAHLQPEVAYHEPHLALDGGKDGLEDIRHLIEVSPDYLMPGGIWLIEMMAGQAEQVVAMLKEQEKYNKIKIYPDLAGIERFVLAYRR